MNIKSDFQHQIKKNNIEKMLIIPIFLIILEIFNTVVWSSAIIFLWKQTVTVDALLKYCLITTVFELLINGIIVLFSNQILLLWIEYDLYGSDALFSRRKLKNDVGVVQTPSDVPSFYNAVDDIAIATHTKVPKMIIMYSNQPNIFTLSLNRNKATICATTALIEDLNEYELEGVIGNQFAHIIDKDCQIKSLILSSVAIFTILGLPLILIIIHFEEKHQQRKLNQLNKEESYYTGNTNYDNYDNYDSDSDSDSGGSSSSDSDSDDGNVAGLIIFIIIVILISALCCFLSLIMQSLLSRKQEYLADAESVNYTRNPEDLINALKILMNRNPDNSIDMNNALASLFIVNPRLKQNAFERIIMYEQPDTQKRIDRLYAMEGIYKNNIK